MKEVIIRHHMTKSDGGPIPSIEELSKEEKADIRLFISFILDWDPASSESIDESGVKITALEFIDDGITGRVRLLDEDVDGCCIEGRPSPVVRYTLDHDVDPEEFKRCIWMSSMKYQPASRHARDEEAYFAEDHNGYTQVVDEATADLIADKHQKPGKKYEFVGGLSAYEGPCLPATEFALEPISKRTQSRSRLKELSAEIRGRLKVFLRRLRS